ncbi:hypothetical protein EDB84DRAFT_696758 [Lactarius hengduanensis]|nr:hypothetical protein EDB84DRAFT_696758 [Lactarius hengduanensis]
MTPRMLLPPNASAEAAVTAMGPIEYPQNESSHPPCLPRTTTSLTRPSSQYHYRFPSLSPSLSRSSTLLDGLLLEAMDNNFYIAVVSSPQSKAGNNTSFSASWFLASNEDPVFRPSACYHHARTLVPTATLDPTSAFLAATSLGHATVDAKPIRAQHGREKRQRRSSVGSVAASDVSGDGRVVMTSSKFLQEAPARKSCLRPNGKVRHRSISTTSSPSISYRISAASVAVIAEWLRM